MYKKLQIGDSASFQFKQKIASKTAVNGRKNVDIIMPLKYLSNVWRTLEMPLINCEINLILTWSEKCVLSNDTKATPFAITGTKFYIPVVTLSTQGNAKILQQLKSGFKRTIDWNKCQLKLTIQAPNPNLDFLIDPTFQGVNSLLFYRFKIRAIEQ